MTTKHIYVKAYIGYNKVEYFMIHENVGAGEITWPIVYATEEAAKEAIRVKVYNNEL